MNSNTVNWYFDEKKFRLYVNGKTKSLKRLAKVKRTDGRSFGLSGEIVFLITRPDYTAINPLKMSLLLNEKFTTTIQAKDILTAIYYQNTQLLEFGAYEFIKIDYGTGNIMINPQYTRLVENPMKPKKVSIFRHQFKKDAPKRTLRDFYSVIQASEALDLPPDSLPSTLPEYKHPFLPNSRLYLIADVDAFIENINELYLDESAAANYLGITSEQLIDFTATGAIKYVETASRSGILYEKEELNKILTSISLN